MTCTQHLAENLRAHGYRITPQRTAILAYLHDTPGHFSPAQVFEHIRQTNPGVTEATVYRTLEFLAVNNLVAPALNSSGHLVYEMAGHAHHHLVCRSCGASMEVDHALLLKLYRQLEKESGYQLNTSHLTFFGLCPGCQEQAS
jgi:Fur family transcriptional regulator, ferric uptake regulator